MLILSEQVPILLINISKYTVCSKDKLYKLIFYL